MHRTTLAAFAAMLPLMAGLAGMTGPARAQMPMPGHGGMGQDAPAAVPVAAAPGSRGDRQDMMAAMERMNSTMMAPDAATGDPDRDLVAMMIPHHQGAVDMARIYLRSGRDPQIRRMAQKIIADQEREIREMRAWQARHPVPPR